MVVSHPQEGISCLVSSVGISMGYISITISWLFQYNEKEEKQKEYATKELQLQALEEKWKVRHICVLEITS